MTFHPKLDPPLRPSGPWPANHRRGEVILSRSRELGLSRLGHPTRFPAGVLGFKWITRPSRTVTVSYGIPCQTKEPWTDPQNYTNLVKIYLTRSIQRVPNWACPGVAWGWSGTTSCTALNELTGLDWLLWLTRVTWGLFFCLKAGPGWPGQPAGLMKKQMPMKTLAGRHNADPT